MAVERHNGRTDLIVGLILVFCVCLLSFSVGTFVGKKFSDQQHKMSQYEPEKANAEHASTESHGENKTGHDEKSLTSEDVAKLAEEFVADDEGTEKTSHDSKTAEHSEAKSETTHVAEQKDTHSTEAGSHSPSKEEHSPVRQIASEDKHEEKGKSDHSEMKIELKKDTAKPQSKKAETTTDHGDDDSHKEPVVEKPAQVANVKSGKLPADLKEEVSGKFTVQIASFPSEKEAESKVNEFKEKFPAFFIPAVIKDKKTSQERTWFRVNLGIFATQREAEAYRKDLIAREKVSSSAIVQKIQ